MKKTIIPIVMVWHKDIIYSPETVIKTTLRHQLGGLIEVNYK